jgi:hypothetical protein
MERQYGCRYDLPDLKGKAHVVTIESAPYETLKSLDGKEAQKIVLHFKNAVKTLPLNLTNFEDWPGQRIELYPTKTARTMAGRRPRSTPRSKEEGDD